MVKIYVIDLKSFRKRLKNKLTKDTLVLVGRISVFVAVSLFAGVCSIAHMVDPFNGDVNSIFSPDSATSLFNDMSESLNKIPKDI